MASTLEISYDGKDYLFDLDDLDTDQQRAMERFGIPNLRTLNDGIENGDLACLTFAYWVMLCQNGEPGARLERIKFKPVKFLTAMAKAAKAASEAEPEDSDPKED